MDPTDSSYKAQPKTVHNIAAGYVDVYASASCQLPVAKKPKPSKDDKEEDMKRHARLESNRKAARESRRRKKVLVEELQRSIFFFTRTNDQLRQNNESLDEMLLAARNKILVEGRGADVPAPLPAMKTIDPPATMTFNQMSAAAPTTTMTAPLPSPAAPPPPTDMVAPSQANAVAVLQQQALQLQSWLAMAQAAAEQVSMAAGTATNNGGMGVNGMGVPNMMPGMVPNPMLMVPSLFGNVNNGGMSIPGENTFAATLGQNWMMPPQQQK